MKKTTRLTQYIILAVLVTGCAPQATEGSTNSSKPTVSQSNAIAEKTDSITVDPKCPNQTIANAIRKFFQEQPDATN